MATTSLLRTVASALSKSSTVLVKASFTPRIWSPTWMPARCAAPLTNGRRALRAPWRARGADAVHFIVAGLPDVPPHVDAARDQRHDRWRFARGGRHEVSDAAIGSLRA
ncbi:hypothetical protein WKW79_20020 [Variovorax robiniae]|uniref:Uncharacterized protein n=1 Tax=Variovorax robiniae TaxID=1836199 RepID=A0ABU8XAR5_9BURK